MDFHAFKFIIFLKKSPVNLLKGASRVKFKELMGIIQIYASKFQTAVKDSIYEDYAARRMHSSTK